MKLVGKQKKVCIGLLITEIILLGYLLSGVFFAIPSQNPCPSGPSLHQPGSSAKISIPWTPGTLEIFILKNAEAPVSLHITNTSPPDTYTPIKSKVNVTNARLWFQTFDEGIYYLVIENPHGVVIEAEICDLTIYFEELIIYGSTFLVLIGLGIFLSIYYTKIRKKEKKSSNSK